MTSARLHVKRAAAALVFLRQSGGGGNRQGCQAVSMILLLDINGLMDVHILALPLSSRDSVLR